MVEQYTGGFAGRAAEIEEGASRPARELIRDVHDSAAELQSTWLNLPEAVWYERILDVSGRERQLFVVPIRRWQELELHLVDLGTGRTAAGWPEDFVTDRLPVMRETLSSRLAGGTLAPAPGEIDPRDELAWLFGRSKRSDLPDLASWE
jgi:maleylpyruvate isomerase